MPLINLLGIGVILSCRRDCEGINLNYHIKDGMAAAILFLLH